MMYVEDQEKPKKGYTIVARGMLMGLAEMVPGVSGGTIAFVTGIYRELITALAAFGSSSIPLLKDWRQFTQHHNLRFLAYLILGIVLGVALLANTLELLLTYFRPIIWAFFGGVVLMSVYVIGRFRHPRALLQWGSVGIGLGLLTVWLPAPTGEVMQIELFFGAIAAMCAWLLPAVSGSYVLLTLGLYIEAIRALANLNWTVIGTMAAGCAVGMLLFSRVLTWLLKRYPESLLSLLTGFMLGSAPALWPWQDDAEADVLNRLLAPEGYRDIMGEPYVIYVSGFFILGAITLWLLSKVKSSQLSI
jgi:putative membrane protein